MTRSRVTENIGLPQTLRTRHLGLAGQQSEHGERRLARSGAGLPHQAQDFAACHGQVHPVDDRLLPVHDTQPRDGQQAVGGHLGGRGMSLPGRTPVPLGGWGFDDAKRVPYNGAQHAGRQDGQAHREARPHQQRGRCGRW
ncbi:MULTISPECIES: hypothetical protein [unclassified Streptomyces]|uniref:hypothetical protein n=1 Tax=unclassified Streptomyces TaxID=2593676 RepID=UPI002B1CCAB6|nr:MULTISPECIES: hypothetical protein [unclassified Streptomyces]